ncbi:hypothetical protein SFRURICE_012293, partial [Spodoptera frugiperda]
VASATAGQGVSDLIPGSGEVLLGFFRFFENFSVVARSLEMCPVYGNRLAILHGTYNINCEMGRCVPLFTVNAPGSMSLRHTRPRCVNFHLFVFFFCLTTSWSSGRKCDYRTKGLGFDSRAFGKVLLGFSGFPKFISSSTDSGNVPSIRQ